MFILFTDCTDLERRPMIHMNLQSNKQPDCSYRLTVEWSVEYNIELLQTLDKFSIVVRSGDDFHNIVSEAEFAHDAVCYISVMATML